MAILLQHLAVKLGIATGRDLAQACRDHYSPPVVWFLWIMCEVAIAACDLAEVVGSAIALQLLFGLPLIWGCVITALDVLIVLLLQQRGFRYLEAVVITLIATIGTCFAVELFIAKPAVGAVFAGFAPSVEILRHPEMLYLAIGILGATVMPHNLYLHSSIVQTRQYEQSAGGKREAIKFATIDSTLALMFALFINAAILILAAATFHRSGHAEVAAIQDAHHLLDGLLGVTFASGLFAVALLASGQNSTLTGTLAGQIVMEGFIKLRLRPWLRRLITRAIAIVPAVAVIGLQGESKTTELLLASQVCLSLQLGFACWPLMRFTERSGEDGRIRERSLAQAVRLGRDARDHRPQPQTPARHHRVDRRWRVNAPHVMYSKILVALENGRADQTLVPQIAALARRLGSSLVLLHVADGFAARNYEQLKLAESDEIRADRAYLATTAEGLRADGLAVETLLAMGNPPTEITKAATAQACDLIAMASHGHKFFGDIFWGSTIDKVRHNTSVPILVVPAERSARAAQR
jgi:manganese transport protein